MKGRSSCTQAALLHLPGRLQEPWEPLHRGTQEMWSRLGLAPRCWCQPSAAPQPASSHGLVLVGGECGSTWGSRGQGSHVQLRVVPSGGRAELAPDRPAEEQLSRAADRAEP